MTISPPPFLYHQLDTKVSEIRLLKAVQQKAVPSDVDLPFLFELQHVALKQVPDFIALSYAWGSKTPPAHISIRASSGSIEGRLQITKNLAEALPQIIASAQGLPLWIDAICINQDNDDEKSTQVTLMGTIYESARTVFVWLGPDEDGTASALRQLDKIGEAILLQPVIWQHQMRYWHARFGHDLSNVKFPPIRDTLEALCARYACHYTDESTTCAQNLKALLNRPWWSRIWVLQEIILLSMKRHLQNVTEDEAVIFLCGSTRSPLHRVAAALTLVRLHSTASTGNLYIAGDLYATSWLNANAFAMASACIWPHKIRLDTMLRCLSGFMRSSQRLEATDPRDRVFALLGLCSDLEELGLVPDYKKSCTDVYTETAAAMTRVYGLLPLMLSHFPKKLVDLPSWVPDWSAESCGYVAYGPEGNIEQGYERFLVDIDPPFRPVAQNYHIPKKVYTKSLNHILCARGIEIASVTWSIADDDWKSFLTEAARAIDSSEFNHLPKAIYPATHSSPTNQAEAIEIREAQRYHGAFRSAHNFTIRSEEMTETVMRPILTPSTPAGPYYALEYYHKKQGRLIIDCINKIQSAMRTSNPAGAAAYQDARTYEDAIWRSLVADREFDDREMWTRQRPRLRWQRPNTNVDNAILFSCTAPSAYQVQITEGTEELGYVATLKQIRERLNALSIFETELSLQTVRFISEDKSSDIYQVLITPETGLIMCIKRHAGDGKAPYDHGILVRPLDEVAVKLSQREALPNRHYSDQQTVRKDLTSGDLSVNELTGAIMEEIQRAYDFKPWDRLNIPAAVKYLRMVQVQAIGQKVFATNQGYFGMGPQLMEPGDKIFLLANWPVPIVLRPLPSGRFRYVGQAYIHGAMDGEILRSKRSGALRVKLVAIE